jgi:hypothetical protein
MAFTFSCPDCGEPIQAGEDTVGRRGRCPHCTHTFTIPDPDEAVRQSSWREEHSSRRPPASHPYPPAPPTDWDAPERVLAPGWRSVRAGLNLVRIGFIMAMFVVLAMVLILALAPEITPAQNRPPQTAEVLLTLGFVLMALVSLAATILILIGLCLCCAAPEESGAKGQAIGMLVCFVFLVLLVLVGVLLWMGMRERDPFGRPPAWGRPPGNDLSILILSLGGLAAILQAVQQILFVLFLRGTASYFQDESLVKSTGVFLILFVIFLGVCLAAGVTLAALTLERPHQPGQDVTTMRIVVLVVGIILLAFGMALALVQLDLIGRARRCITRALND